MTCKEAEKMIPLFLEDALDTDDLREFMDHMDKCEECKEELSIQFLVLEGMTRLETGNVFDLQNELKFHMENAERTLRLREGMQWLLYIIQGLTVIAAITLAALLAVFF